MLKSQFGESGEGRTGGSSGGGSSSSCSCSSSGDGGGNRGGGGGEARGGHDFMHDFIPSASFVGAKEGYAYTRGEQGQGYYWLQPASNPGA
jgi:hypothetical protein